MDVQVSRMEPAAGAGGGAGAAAGCLVAGRTPPSVAPPSASQSVAGAPLLQLLQPKHCDNKFH